MSFMTYSIIKDHWLFVETRNGTVYIPMTGLFRSYDVPDVHDVQVYIEDKLPEDTQMAVYEGWGCQLTAPGYMDQTEWSAVFDTPEQAGEHLLELYGSDDEEYEEDWEKELRTAIAK